MTDLDLYLLQANNPASATEVRSQALQEPRSDLLTRLIQISTECARRKWMILSVAGLGAVVGTILAFLLPVRYKSTARILTPQQTQSSAAMVVSQIANSAGGILPAAAGGALGLRNPNDLYVGLLSSRPIADAIIHEFDLQSAYRAKDMTDARKELANNTQIVAEKSGILAVSVMDRNKMRAANIANAYAAQLRVLTKNLAVTEASQRRMFYENQLQGAKEDLLTAEQVFRKIQQQKGLIHLDAQAKAAIGNLANLQAQIEAKQVQLRAARSYSTERNPQLQVIQNELAALQAEASSLMSSDSSPGSTMALQQVADSGLEYLRAEHELQYRQTLFDLLIKQLDAARLDEAKNGAVIQVVESAIPPDHKEEPHRASIVILLTMLSSVGSCCYVFLSQSIQSNPQFSSSLHSFKTALVSR